MKQAEEAMMDVQEQNAAPAADMPINQQKIDEWKKEFGRIFRTQIGDIVIIWHRLTRGEYIKIMTDEAVNAEADQDTVIYKRQEEALRTVALYPDKDTLNDLIEQAGCLATNIGGEIMDVSGFSVTKTDER